MTNKDKCKAAMAKLFGPATARLVDTMDESQCVSLCRKKVEALLSHKLAEFDELVK